MDTLSLEEYVVLDHGTGAKRSKELVSLIVSELGDSHIGLMEDSAVLHVSMDRIAVTTDSFVVAPYIFGNGNIGKIAVCGTVNDLAVMGAKPLYLTLSMILEVGLPISDLKVILQSIRDTASEAGVKIVAGDTKVVGKGEADKIFINTSGVGVFEREPLSMVNVGAGDVIILSGNIGDHSIHLLSIREGLGFEREILSDSAPLNGLIEDLLEPEDHGIKSIRDVTRGGFGSVLHEYVAATGLNTVFDSSKLPIQHETAMAADMLGINPIYLANEGCICIFVRADCVDSTLETLRNHKYGRNAVAVGKISSTTGKLVEIESATGGVQYLEELSGAELPRLC